MSVVRLIAFCCVWLVPLFAFGQATLDWRGQREQMVSEVLRTGGIQNQRVLAAMRNTPRHEFVPRHLRRQAYLDMALPIGESQTISSPFIVAFMTECIDPQPNERVLEIGTGSGYQAAVLSLLAKEVYSIEIVETLGRRANRTLKRLRLKNVQTKIGDGYQGWAEHAPFDKIIVTCSPESVPDKLVQQLRDGGRMVIPVGQRYQQTMYLLRKRGDKLETEALRPTLFVPMTGSAEDNRQLRPDPSNPTLINGSFEKEADENGFVAGWYYQRQAEQIEADDAPEGRRFMKFENATPGRDCHLMQGLALDGRRVSRIRLAAWCRTGTTTTNQSSEGPRVVITFYDEDRRDLGQWWLGPWYANESWRREQKEIVVPKRSREAIVRIGLFGGTGTAFFDDIALKRLDP